MSPKIVWQLTRKTMRKFTVQSTLFVHSSLKSLSGLRIQESQLSCPSCLLVPVSLTALKTFEVISLALDNKMQDTQQFSTFFYLQSQHIFSVALLIHLICFCSLTWLHWYRETRFSCFTVGGRFGNKPFSTFISRMNLLSRVHKTLPTMQWGPSYASWIWRYSKLRFEVNYRKSQIKSHHKNHLRSLLKL